MKNKISKFILAVSFVGTSVMAGSTPYSYDSHSLVGIEGSYNTYDVEHGTTPVVREKKRYGGVGFKIGAETDNVRLFLSVRNSFISSYTYAYTLGGELEYKFNFSKYANFFVGGVGGMSYARFEDNLNETRNFSSPYVGGDAGFNFHLTKSVDFEVGGRVTKLLDSTDTSTSAGADDYIFDNTLSAYASIIFRYQMDWFW